MTTTNTAVMINLTMFSGLPSRARAVRTAEKPATTAKTMKMKPISSFHRVRAGFRVAGMTCRANKIDCRMRLRFATFRIVSNEMPCTSSWICGEEVRLPIKSLIARSKF
jgi:hypothetical protein